MGVLKFEGTLTAGPPSSSSDVFPSTVQTTPIATAQGSKSYQVATGVLSRNLIAPAYVAFPELGTNAAVTKGTFLYLRSNAPVDVRITTDDGLGGSVVAVIPVFGPFSCEFPDNKFLKLLEVQGSAALEYFICGNQ